MSEICLWFTNSEGSVKWEAFVTCYKNKKAWTRAVDWKLLLKFRKNQEREEKNAKRNFTKYVRVNALVFDTTPHKKIECQALCLQLAEASIFWYFFRGAAAKSKKIKIFVTSSLNQNQLLKASVDLKSFSSTNWWNIKCTFVVFA